MVHRGMVVGAEAGGADDTTRYRLISHLQRDSIWIGVGQSIHSLLGAEDESEVAGGQVDRAGRL